MAWLAALAAQAPAGSVRDKPNEAGGAVARAGFHHAHCESWWDYVAEGPEQLSNFNKFGYLC